MLTIYNIQVIYNGVIVTMKNTTQQDAASVKIEEMLTKKEQQQIIDRLFKTEDEEQNAINEKIALTHWADVMKNYVCYRLIQEGKAKAQVVDGKVYTVSEHFEAVEKYFQEIFS